MENQREKLCRQCPRMCGVDRDTAKGICGEGNTLRIARAAPHFWEEPCISGYGGSGAVFFSGCNLKCVFCQNMEISRENKGKAVTIERLREIYEELIFEGVHNINLVTPSHFPQLIARTLDAPLSVPVVYNSSGYDSVESLRLFEGKVQIYLPDMKYMRSEPALKYSRAKDYPQVAKAAICEMLRQVGPFRLDDEGIMTRGVLIRHLMLPGQLQNTLDVIDWVSSELGDKVLFSLMSQYTPPPNCACPELCSRVSEDEYNRAVDYMYLVGMENGYVQDFSSAKSSFTPDFDLTGV